MRRNDNFPVRSGLLPVVLLLLVVCALGCGTLGLKAPFVPPQGFTFANTTMPLDLDFDGGINPKRVGKSSSITILWLFAFGSASPAKAAWDGRIERVEHADYNYLNILGIYQSVEVLVYGPPVEDPVAEP